MTRLFIEQPLALPGSAKKNNKKMTCDVWHVTSDTWHMTCDIWHMTRDMWHVKFDMLWGVNILSKFQLPSSSGLWFRIFWRLGGKGWLSDWMSNEADCRTAPATPGLLKMHHLDWIGLGAVSVKSFIPPSAVVEWNHLAPFPSAKWGYKVCNIYAPPVVAAASPLDDLISYKKVKYKNKNKWIIYIYIYLARIFCNCWNQ